MENVERNIIQDLHHYCENNKWLLVSWAKDTNGLYILYMNKKGGLRYGFIQEPKQIRYLKKKYGD